MKKKEPSSARVNLSDLHESLLQQILALVDVYNLPACIQVCKKWHSIITMSPYFAQHHASLHRDHTWFTLFTSPSRNCMLLYDTTMGKAVWNPCLVCANEPPLAAADGLTSKHREQLQKLSRVFLSEDPSYVAPLEEPLATAEGLVLSRSDCGIFTITNIVTRKKKPLPPPNRRIRHLAFVGMAYSWQSMSYQVLLCGQPESPRQGDAAGLITSVFSSLTRSWTDAASTLSGEFFCPQTFPFPSNKFGVPRNCVFFAERFYCVMGRSLLFFDLAAMEWGSLHSLWFHKGLHESHHRMEIQMPPELSCFFCLWEHEGELRLAGCAENNEANEPVTRLWHLVPPLQETGLIASNNDSSNTFQWKHVAFVCPIFEGKQGYASGDMQEVIPIFEGNQGYARGDTFCFRSIDETDGADLPRATDTPKGSQVHFCLYELSKKSVKRAMSVWLTEFFEEDTRPANLSIQPCPFTSP